MFDGASSGVGGQIFSIFILFINFRFASMVWSVYILKCADGTYYTGCTNSIPQRLKRHANGEVLYTSKRLPVELITYIVFNDKYKAYHFEKYLKSGSGKAFANKRFL